MGLRDIFNASKIRKENDSLKEMMSPDMKEAVIKAAKKLNVPLSEKGDGKFEGELTPALLRRLLADASCVHQRVLIPVASMADAEKKGRLDDMLERGGRTTFVVRREDQEKFGKFSLRKGAA